MGAFRSSTLIQAPATSQRTPGSGGEFQTDMHQRRVMMERHEFMSREEAEQKPARYRECEALKSAVMLVPYRR